MISENGKALVYKSNELIEGRYRLSAVAQKIAASVISQVDPADSEPLPKFCLTISELSELSGVPKKRLVETISRYTKELKSIVIEVRKPQSHGYIQLGLFRQFELKDNKWDLEIEFEDRLAEHIKDFSSNFTKYHLIQLHDLKSRYSIRMYEILRKAHNIGKSRSSITHYQQNLDVLKKMLGAEDSYSDRYDLFRRNALVRAQKELKEKTDITFDFESIRYGKKVGAVKFTVKHNADFKPKDGTIDLLMNMPQYDYEMDPGAKTLITHSLPWVPNSTLKKLAKYDRDVLTKSVIDMLSRLESTEKLVTNKIAYFTKLVEINGKAMTSEQGQTLQEKMSDRSWDLDD